jgi:putative membrane protein
MLRALLQIVLNGLGLLLAAHLVPGIHYQGGLLYLLLAGLVIGLINLLVKPLVTLLSLPLIILTLGLFYLAVNGLMLYLAAGLLSGLSIDGCLPAILGGLVMGLFNWAVRAFAEA